MNYKWNGSSFVEGNPSLTSTRFTFNGNQLQIDDTRLTITNRITNSSGDFLTATADDGSNLKLSISLTVEKDAKGRKFKCITVERAKIYKLVYYLK